MAMRRLFLLLALVLAAAAVGPAVLASASTDHHGQVSGTGTLGQFGDPTAHVNAIQTAPGLKGGFTITYPDGTFAAGSATCLAIAGTTAYVTAQITSSGGPRQQALNWLPGGFLVIGVQDNGEPGTAGPDRLNFSPGFAADPGCGPNAAATPVFSITAGNYRVFSLS
jgi:hypothetical protein